VELWCHADPLVFPWELVFLVLGCNPCAEKSTSFFWLRPLLEQAAYDDVWGEHEVDYILICRPKNMVRLNVNPNEVAEVRAFAPEELREWAESADSR
jgi:isopentenyldiphosphate isomerase